MESRRSVTTAETPFPASQPINAYASRIPPALEYILTIYSWFMSIMEVLTILKGSKVQTKQGSLTHTKMEFFNQTYIALRGPAEPVTQSPHETISRLADRLSQSTQLEDRRAALFALRGLSRDYRQEVGSTALDSILTVLDGDAQVDPDVAKALLQTLNTLCEVEIGGDFTAEHRETALSNTDKLLQDPKHTQKLFGLLPDPSYQTKFGTLQLLNTLVTNRRSVVQSHFLNAPEYSQTVTAVLEEKRDIIRNGMSIRAAVTELSNGPQRDYSFSKPSLLRVRTFKQCSHLEEHSSRYSGSYRKRVVLRGGSHRTAVSWPLRVSFDIIHRLR